MHGSMHRLRLRNDQVYIHNFQCLCYILRQYVEQKQDQNAHEEVAGAVGGSID